MPTITYSLVKYRRISLLQQIKSAWLDTNLPLFIVVFPLIIIQGQQVNIDSLLITEVYYTPPGIDADREWVEIANVGQRVISLADIKLGDEESIWGGEGMLRFPEDAVIKPGQVIIVAQKAVGFRELYGRDPDFEINNSVEMVPDMDQYKLWSSGDFALANDGDEVLLLDANDSKIDAINYGDEKTFFDPSIGDVFEGQSIERIPANCDTDSAADWQPQRFPTPGKIQVEQECLQTVNDSTPASELLTIGEIQGDGDVSSYVNQVVSFRGIVTGYMEDRNADGITFYSLFLQSIPGEEDGDQRTSDGIVVFLGTKKPSFHHGNIVNVTGKVTEFFGLTEIDDLELAISLENEQGIPPEPIIINPPSSDTDKMNYYETLEGTLVKIPEPSIVAGPTHAGCGFDVFDPSSIAPLPPIRRIDETRGPILSILHRSDVDCTDLPQVKIGDQIAGLVGPLTYHFDRYKIVLQNVNNLSIAKDEFPLLLPAPILEDQQISMASYNLANFFDEKRDSANEAEPIISEDLQGIKRQKLDFVLTQILKCPSLIAVQEAENKKVLDQLADQLQTNCGFRYQINHQDGPDSRGLDVALLSNPAIVQVLAEKAHQDCTNIETDIIDPQIECPGGQYPLFGRPPLQVDAIIAGKTYQFIVVHLKSKRGDAIESEQRRIAQVQYLNKIVNENIKQNPQMAVFILGDFNDYEQSSTMEAILDGGLLYSALKEVALNERYSYIFDGRTQLIDGILYSKNMEQQIAYTNIFHVNADFPVGMAYDITAERLPYHSSDHDIPFVVLNVGEEQQTSEILPFTTPKSNLSQPQPQQIARPDRSLSTTSDEPGESMSSNSPLWEHINVYWLGGGIIVLFLTSWLLFMRIKRQ